MADERPLNLVQFVVGYFDTWTLNETLGFPKPLCRGVRLLLWWFRNSELSQYLLRPNSWLTKLPIMKSNDQFIKSWVHLRPPFEYHPGWKAFLPMPTTFRQLAEMPGGRCRTNELSRFTLTRTVSSGPKLAALDLTDRSKSTNKYANNS